jgi:hypothetical protein
VDSKKVTLSDILYEYLGKPSSLEEAAERAQESLSPRGRELLRELQLRRPVRGEPPKS